MKKTKDQIQSEALNAIANLKKAGIEVSMGVGKTLLGLKDMKSNYTDYCRFLVVAPKVTIFDSWKDDAKKFDMEYMLDHINFSTYISLPKQDLDYDVVYLDECHSVKATHVEWLKAFEKKGGRVIGMTGTYPTKKYTEKGKICDWFCPLVYKYHTDDAVEDKILNDYRIYIHKLSLDARPIIEKTSKDGRTWMTSEIKEYAYWTSRLDGARSPKEEQICRIQRMKALQQFPSKEAYAKRLFNACQGKTIIFANTQSQADDLCEHSFHSNNKNSKDNLILFKTGEITKLSAVEQLSEGVTIPNLKTGIIMHAYANNRKASQKIGRMLRLNPDDMATIHILCYANSVDKDWVKSALEHLDQSKIKWVEPMQEQPKIGIIL
jgi:superfamily II DNA or RNA helicase